MKLELLNRALTAAALVALAITLGVWLTRSPLTAAPKPDAAPTPVRPYPAKPLIPPTPRAGFPKPTLAPLPIGFAAPAATPQTVTTDVETSYEVAPASVVADTPVSAPPIAKPAVRKQVCDPSDCQQSYRRRFFSRR